MKLGQVEIDRGDISVILMIFFAMFAMFMLGYKFAYTKAVNYANEQIDSIISEYEAQKVIVDPNNMFTGYELVEGVP